MYTNKAHREDIESPEEFTHLLSKSDFKVKAMGLSSLYFSDSENWENPNSSDDGLTAITPYKSSESSELLQHKLTPLLKSILKFFNKLYMGGLKPFIDGQLTTAWPVIITLFANIWSKNRATINPMVELGFNIPITIIVQTVSMLDYYGYLKHQNKKFVSLLLHMLKRGIDGLTPMMVTVVLLSKLAGALFTVYQCGEMTQQECDKTAKDNNLLLAGIVLTIVSLSCSAYIASTGMLGQIKEILEDFPLLNYKNSESFNAGIPLCKSAFYDKWLHRVSFDSYQLSKSLKFFGNTLKFFSIGFGSTYMSMLTIAQFFPKNPEADILKGSAVTAAEAITFPTIAVAGVYGTIVAGLTAKKIGRGFFNGLYYLLAFYALSITDLYNRKNSYDMFYQNSDNISECINTLTWIYLGLIGVRLLLVLTAAIPSKFLSKKTDNLQSKLIRLSDQSIPHNINNALNKQTTINNVDAKVLVAKGLFSSSRSEGNFDNIEDRDGLSSYKI